MDRDPPSTVGTSMRTWPFRDEIDTLTAALSAILRPAHLSTEAEWGASVARAACALLRCTAAELTVRIGEQVRTFSHAAIATPASPGPTVRVTSANVEANVAANVDAEDGRRPELELACHLARGRASADFIGREQALLDALRPALMAAAHTRFAAQVPESFARLLDAFGTPVAACANDGRIVYGSEALRQLLATEPRESRLLQDIACAAVDAARSPEARARPRVVTGRYRVAARRVAHSPAPAPASAATATATAAEAALALVTVLRMDPQQDAINTAELLRRRYKLTRREAEVTRCLVGGQSNSAIAHTLAISEATARHHTQRVLEKLGVHSRSAIPSMMIGR